jgi:hypothetical protein
MKRFPLLLAATCVLAAPPLLPAVALAADDVEVTLRGSRASMLRQNRIAKEESFSFLRTPTQVRRFVDDGHLVHVPGSGDYSVIAGYPYARPIVLSFIERLGADYHAACGEKLVVTSLTRPAARQPRNASPLSVHPAGMAVDLRVSGQAECRDWLARELLALEEMGVLDATREYSPPHFHIAVFPTSYQRYDQTMTALAAAEEATRLLEEAVARRLAEEAAADAAAELAAAAGSTTLALPLALPHRLVRVGIRVARLVLSV